MVKECSGQEEESEGARAGAVSAALLLALFMGLVQALVYLALAGPILSASCVGPGTPMRAEALAYLRVCAAGAPAATIWLVVNGIFRGLGDTPPHLLHERVDHFAAAEGQRWKAPAARFFSS